MNMTVSVNNQSGIPYTEVGTPRQKRKAKEFASASNYDVNKLSAAITHRKNHDVQVAKNVAKALIAIPFVGAAASMILTKGKVSQKSLAGAKTFAKEAAYLAVPFMVVDANKKLADGNKSVARTQRKHPLATLGAELGATFGIFAGAKALSKHVPAKVVENVKTLAQKVKLDKLAAKMDEAPQSAKTAISNLAAKISLPKAVKENISKIASKVKIPQQVKDGFSNVVNSETAKTALATSKNVGNKLLRNAPLAMVGAITAGLLIHGIKNAVVMSHTKSKIKEAQLKTANNLVDAYAVENDSLKSANAKAADTVEKAKDVVADSSAKADKETEEV